MAKEKSVFVCQACGAVNAKWQGKCPSCDAWNSLEEQADRDVGSAKNRFTGLAPTQPITNLSEIKDAELTRIPTGIEELDRVLGGGIVEGGVMLLGGEPGFGKSTLLIQAAEALSKELRVMYVSGEESGGQVAMRARRLGLSGDKIRFMGEISLEKVLSAVERERPQFVVIDSIQTMYSEALSSSPGSVTQVKECAGQLVRIAKANGPTFALVGHVTKGGDLAGPQVLAHQVDTVLAGEGDTGSPYRLLRATKNRFGAVNELGVFAMTATGMRGVSNPSAIFMSTHSKPVPGSCIVATMEGSRPMLVELQALCSSGGPSPRRLSVGLERERLAMLLAVLARHAGITTSDQDVFALAVGGVHLDEPATDLAVLLAIASSLRNKPLPEGFFAMGEVGLVGEVRPSPRGQERLKEAARLGMSMALIPKSNLPKKPIEGLTLHGVDRIEEALEIVQSF